MGFHNNHDDNTNLMGIKSPGFSPAVFMQGKQVLPSITHPGEHTDFLPTQAPNKPWSVLELFYPIIHKNLKKLLNSAG